MTEKTKMQVSMVGLGRMGANMVRRLQAGGHRCVVFDRSPQSIEELVKENAVGASSLANLVNPAAAEAPARDSTPAELEGRVSDSGEGRWTIQAAIDEAVPAPVLSTALYTRFASRGEADFQGKLLSAMRRLRRPSRESGEMKARA